MISEAPNNFEVGFGRALALGGSRLLGDSIEGATGKSAPATVAREHNGFEVGTHGAALGFGLLVFSFLALVTFKHRPRGRSGSAKISASYR